MKIATYKIQKFVIVLEIRRKEAKIAVGHCRWITDTGDNG
jgi:hypothetical protein